MSVFKKIGLYHPKCYRGSTKSIIGKTGRNFSGATSIVTSSRDSKQPLPSEFLSLVSSSLPHVGINRNKYDLNEHGKGEGQHPVAPPAAILTPHSTKDVSVILKLCNQYRVPLIAYGAGTSVEGHISALSANSISLDMKEFKDVGIPNDGMLEDACVDVGAGVTRLELNHQLRYTGMQFMVDPGADASIGGMVACGASGTTAVKYGTMRENILGLECVLPDGTIASCGTKGALKSSAGYDLTSLMTGSEGTLGVITNITVKLHPIPEHVMAAVCTFDTLHKAAEAVATMRMCSIPVERCELLDESSVAAFNQYANSGKISHMDGESESSSPVPKPSLFLEFAGSSQAAVREQVELTESICVDDFGASNFQYKQDEEERNALWVARHKLYYASLALRPGATNAVLTDACVPLSKFADLITATVKDVEAMGVVGPCFGHAGDGNFHCILPLIDGDSEDYIARVNIVNDNLIRRTIEAGGTCTGEHGIGYGKIKYLQQQYGDGGVRMMEIVKRGIDRNNIMNPGKVVELSPS